MLKWNKNSKSQDECDKYEINSKLKLNTTNTKTVQKLLESAKSKTSGLFTKSKRL